MRSLRARFILSHVLPILISVPLMVVALLYLLETQVLLTALSENITEKANLVVTAVNGRPEVWRDVEQASAFIAEVSPLVDESVVLVRPDGTLLAGSGSVEDLDLVAAGNDTQLVVTYGLLDQQAVAFVPVRDLNQQLVGIVGVGNTLAGTAAEFQALRRWLAGIMGVELILAGVLGMWLALRLEQPVRRAALAVVDVAAGRQVVALQERGPTELKALARAVNSLAERLRTLEEARRLSLANVVHELGRPLGAIRSAVYVLRHGAGDDPATRAELLGGIDDTISRMQPLLDDLSQLHGQVTGTLQLERSATDLNAWLPGVLVPWGAAAAEKNIHWQVELAPDLPTLSVDERRLAQAVANLCSNAIKFTPAGGAVTVAAGADDNQFWLRVRDTGPGIVAAERQQVFEPFFRSQQQRRFPQGLGLGLTIARDIVRAHGGRIALISTPGQGSEFTIYLPR